MKDDKHSKVEVEPQTVNGLITALENQSFQIGELARSVEGFSHAVEKRPTRGEAATWLIISNVLTIIVVMTMLAFVLVQANENGDTSAAVRKTADLIEGCVISTEEDPDGDSNECYARTQEQQQQAVEDVNLLTVAVAECAVQVSKQPPEATLTIEECVAEKMAHDQPTIPPSGD